ncbi:unnamed protein product [Moneuplotes crassus]|uniref:Uncharacterized protein n=1 Tax=Euplotes crassus TaxID=5936 RepID=A0AAD1UM82_EUPCR|nr:unnamed protein product [Moneuplotes crassus]
MHEQASKGIYKIILRMFRRFYHKFFIQQNKGLVKKRFRRCHSHEILEACRELLNKYLNIEPSEDFTRFLFRILRINTKDTLECVNSHDKDAIDISINMISFSLKRFERSFRNKYFRILFLNILEGTLPDSQSKCIDLFYNHEVKIISRSSQYQKALNYITQKCKENDPV